MYDQKCADIADAFLDDYHVNWKRDKVVSRIANAVQVAIENELSDLEDEGAIGELQAEGRRVEDR